MTINIKEIIDNELIEIHYQLIVSPNKDIAAGVEALVRAKNPHTGEIIYPADLFKAANVENLVLEFEMAIISEALNNFKPLYAKHNEMLLFINVGEDVIKLTKDL